VAGILAARTSSTAKSGILGAGLEMDCPPLEIKGESPMHKLFSGFDRGTRRILGACFLAFFLNGLTTLMMGSLLPDMKASYGLTDTQSGIILSGHSIGNLIACFLSGLVSLWLGRRKAIVALSIISSIGFTMVLFFGNPLWLIAAFILTGIGRGSISNFNNATVNRVTHGDPSASNVLHSFFAAGAICAPLVFLLASRVAGWKTAVVCIVLLGIGVTVNFSTLRLPDDRPDRADQSQKSLAFLRNPSFLIFCGMMFFYLCAEYSINGWLVTYLQSKPDLLKQFTGPDAHAGLVAYSQTMATLLWAIMLAGRLTSAALAHRLPQKLLMMLDSVGVLIFFILLLSSHAILPITLSIAGLGFCMAGICPMIYSDASYINNVYPMGTSTILAIGSVGAIVMPVLVGIMADAYGFAGA